MSLTFEVARELVSTGEFGLLRSRAQAELAGNLRLEPRTLVLIAQALVHAGDDHGARQLISRLDLESRALGSVRARAWLVSGLANRAVGAMTSALSDLQRALHLAQESGAEDEIAWMNLHLLRQLVDGDPSGLAPAFLPSVRRAVARAGSSQAMAYLHMCVAVMEGQGGRLDEAYRHCDVSDDLRSLSPNVWLECGSQQNRAAILLADCRYPEAVPILQALKETASRHGLVHELARAEINLAHLEIMLGRPDRGIAVLSRIAESPQTSRLASLSALESVARAYLFQRNYGECVQTLARMSANTAADPRLASAWGVRWSEVTRARMLLALGKPDEAVKHLEKVAASTSGSEDVPLAAAVSIVTAQARARTGRSALVARELLRADQLGVTQFKELRGQFYAVASAAIGASVPLVSLMRERAVRVWKSQGTAWMADEPAVADAPPTFTGERVGDATSAVSALAAAFDLAREPQLFGQELLSVLRLIDCGDRARLVSTRGRTAEEVDTLSLTLGEGAVLQCNHPDAPDKALAASSVFRLGKAALELERLRTEERRRSALWPESPSAEQPEALFRSEEMQDLINTARRISNTDVPVLITGETGTGKEVMARLIHSNSSQSRQPFVAFNCSSVPKDIVDSQLFGHKRGAFTGATENFSGLIRSAHGGTLFLDEIGDMPLDVQPKLLRFLESGEVHALGDSRPTQVAVRIIAATNTDLDKALESGRFRDDLYYRLNIVQLRLPPLRERRSEIPELAIHYLDKYAREFKKGRLRLSEGAVEHLIIYRWPGNIRQLANEMRRVAALAENEAVVTADDLAREIAGAESRRNQVRELSLDGMVTLRLDQEMASATEELERAMISRALRESGGRVDVAAKVLGLSRKGLYLKRMRYFPEESLNDSVDEVQA